MSFTLVHGRLQEPEEEGRPGLPETVLVWLQAPCRGAGTAFSTFPEPSQSTALVYKGGGYRHSNLQFNLLLLFNQSRSGNGPVVGSLKPHFQHKRHQ